MKLRMLYFSALLMATIAAQAYPTLVGPTGAGVLPTAAIAPAGHINVAADYYNSDNQLVPDSNKTYPIRVLVGLGANTEIGGLFAFHKLGQSNENTWDANIKYRLPFHAFGSALSVGAIYARSQRGAFASPAVTTGEQAYLVGDFTLSRASRMSLTGSLGVNWTRIDENDEAHVDRLRGFAAANLGLTSSLSLVADIQTKSRTLGDIDPLYSVALRYGASKTLGLQVGYTNAAGNFLIGSGQGRIFAGANLSFGGHGGSEGGY